MQTWVRTAFAYSALEMSVEQIRITPTLALAPINKRFVEWAPCRMQIPGQHARLLDVCPASRSCSQHGHGGGKGGYRSHKCPMLFAVTKE